MKDEPNPPRQKKWLKRTLWTLATLITLTVLFYSIERWRGARAWEKTEAFLEEEGETTDFSKLRPAPIPESENFCAIPLLASLTHLSVEGDGEVVYEDPQTRNRFLAMRLPEPGGDVIEPKMPEVDESQAIDLNAWAKFLSGAGGEASAGGSESSPESQIRQFFEPSDADFREIAEAARDHPGAWFPVHYGETFLEIVSTPLPQVQDVMQFSAFLTVKGAAAAASGDIGTSKDCILINLKLAKAMGAEPILISHLVNMAIVSRVGAIIREGIVSELWGEDDLKWIENQFAEIDFFERGAHAMRGEMTGFYLPATKYLKSASFGGWGNAMGLLEGGSPGVAALLIPDGWLDQNAATGCEILYNDAILPLKNRNLKGLSEFSISGKFESTTPYNFLARLALPAIGAVVQRTGQGQALVESIRVATALERYRLQHTAYPETLGELVPEFLAAVPGDPMTGEPLLFKKDDAGYRVYSVGPDEVDNGGVIVRKSGGRVDRNQGDWVWSVGTSVE